MPSGQGGLYYNFNLREKFSLGGELLFTQIEGKQLYQLSTINKNNQPSYQYADFNSWQHISYLGIPVYFGLNLKKMNFNIGFKANFKLIYSGRMKGQIAYNGSSLQTFDKIDKLNIDSYDFGGRIGLTYRLSDKFRIEANYYYSFNNIISDAIASKLWTWKVQQMTVGLHYKLFQSAGKKTE